MNLHPATQILIWCMLVAVMQFMMPGRLLMVGGLVMLCAFVLSRHKFIQLVRRTRWIMISLWLIYACTTPGEPLSDQMGAFSPTLEGVLDGGLQLTRLLVALAGLAILLDRLHRRQLMAGLYALFVPLDWLGLSRERLAVRLALTLHYAEVAMLRETRTWRDALQSLFEPHGEISKTLEIHTHRFSLLDVLSLSSAGLLLWLVT